MKHVLFVCLGNICRSPMAEAVFQHLVSQAGLNNQIRSDSAGTGDYHIGKPPHLGTLRVLREQGIEYTHAARQLHVEDLSRFDYLIAMDQSNLRDMQQLGRIANARVRLLMDYVPNASCRDVPDPYYNGNFQKVYDLIDRGCRGLLDEIRRDLAA